MRCMSATVVCLMHSYRIKLECEGMMHSYPNVAMRDRERSLRYNVFLLVKWPMTVRIQRD